MYPRNAASPPRIAIGAVLQISDGAVQTSGVDVVVQPEGGSETAQLGTIAYGATSNIVYYTPTQAETDYTAFVVTAYKASCVPVSQTIITTASSTAGQTVMKSTASGAITATSLASDTITAAKVAADAVTKIQAGVATEAKQDIIDTNVDAIQVITDALTVGAAAKLALSMLANITGVAAAGTLTTTTMTTDLTGYEDDELNTRTIIWTGGTAAGQAREITDYASSNGTVTFGALATAPIATDPFVIV